MILEYCYIEGFGGLRSRAFTFTEGLNVFCEDNGFGKSTLAAFIKAMFYGLSENKKQSLLENERKHYTPWDGGSFGGYMIFQTESARLRIERTFGARPSEDTFNIYSCDSGTPYQMREKTPGEEFFGIDADGFLRTVFLSERILEEKNDNPTIAKRLSELVGVSGDTMDATPALQLLEEQRKIYYKRGGRGKIGEVGEDIATLTAQINDLLRLKEEARRLEEERVGVAESLSECEARRRALDRQKAALPQRDRSAAEIERQKERLLRAEEELLAHSRFFESASTTHEELGKMQAISLNLASLKRERSRNVYKTEEISRPTTSYDEIYRMQRLWDDAQGTVIEPEEADERLESLSRLFSDLSETKEGFGRLTASFEAKATRKKKRMRLGLIFASLTLAFALLGFALPYLFIGAALFALPSAYLLFQKEKNTDTRVIESLYKTAHEEGEEISAFCRRITALYGEYLDRAQSADKRRRERQQEEDARLQRLETVKEYLRRFEGLPSEPPLAFQTLMHSVTEHSLNLQRTEEAAREGIRLDNEIGMLEGELTSYLSRYPTSTSDPFAEIREHLFLLSKSEETVRAYRAELEKYSADEDSGADETWRRLEGEEETLREQKEALVLRRAEIDARLYTLGERISELDEKEARLSELREEKESAEGSLNTILSTMSLLKQAKENLTLRYLKGTKEGFERYVALFDGEAGGEFYMTPTFEVSRSDLGKIRTSEAYSRGTRDLYALAARFSLIGALYEKEKPPILLDDPFVNLDDGRIENALSLIKNLSKEVQIIYFTCSHART